MRRQIPFAKSGHQVHDYAFIGTQTNLEMTPVDRFTYGVPMRLESNCIIAAS